MSLLLVYEDIHSFEQSTSIIFSHPAFFFYYLETLTISNTKELIYKVNSTSMMNFNLNTYVMKVTLSWYLYLRLSYRECHTDFNTSLYVGWLQSCHWHNREMAPMTRLPLLHLLFALNERPAPLASINKYFFFQTKFLRLNLMHFCLAVLILSTLSLLLIIQ